jgi:hypothetical protein
MEVPVVKLITLTTNSSREKSRRKPTLQFKTQTHKKTSMIIRKFLTPLPSKTKAILVEVYKITSLVMFIKV